MAKVRSREGVDGMGNAVNNKVRLVQSLFQAAKQVGDLNASPIDHTGRRSLVVTTVHVSKRS